jgi:hypothetical protein
MQGTLWPTTGCHAKDDELFMKGVLNISNANMVAEKRLKVIYNSFILVIYNIV